MNAWIRVVIFCDCTLLASRNAPSARLAFASNAVVVSERWIIFQYVSSSNVATAYTSYPSSYELNAASVWTVWEPSDGQYPNNGPGTSSGDDYNGAWYSDHDFFDLCGPGAADVALYYWPAPPNAMTNPSVTDKANWATTGWTSKRFRGYMTYLAWQLNDPVMVNMWGYVGMMDPNHYYSWGMNNYQMADGLNWELSGHANSTQFYIPTFWTDSNADGFRADVEDDLVNSNVPVVVNVDANILPNWNPNGYTQHFITIIGYDNTTQQYYYTDTCAQSTACGSNNDGTIRVAYQSVMWQAITAIPVDKKTTLQDGNGGWIW